MWKYSTVFLHLWILALVPGQDTDTRTKQQKVVDVILDLDAFIKTLEATRDQSGVMEFTKGRINGLIAIAKLCASELLEYTDGTRDINSEPDERINEAVHAVKNAKLSMPIFERPDGSPIGHTETTETAAKSFMGTASTIPMSLMGFAQSPPGMAITGTAALALGGGIMAAGFGGVTLDTTLNRVMGIQLDLQELSNKNDDLRGYFEGYQHQFDRLFSALTSFQNNDWQFTEDIVTSVEDIAENYDFLSVEIGTMASFVKGDTTTQTDETVLRELLQLSQQFTQLLTVRASLARLTYTVLYFASTQGVDCAGPMGTLWSKMNRWQKSISGEPNIDSDHGIFSYFSNPTESQVFAALEFHETRYPLLKEFLNVNNVPYTHDDFQHDAYRFSNAYYTNYEILLHKPGRIPPCREESCYGMSYTKSTGTCFGVTKEPNGYRITRKDYTGTSYLLTLSSTNKFIVYGTDAGAKSRFRFVRTSNNKWAFASIGAPHQPARMRYSWFSEPKDKDSDYPYPVVKNINDAIQGERTIALWTLASC